MQNQSEKYFSKSTKLADAILTNYKLLTVLPRFDIKLGFGEKSIGEICTRYGLDVNLFTLVCNVYTFQDYLPHAEDLLKIDVDLLIDYLQKSHNYYLNEKLSIIDNQLANLNAHQDANINNVLLTFFINYKTEVIKHFEYEELTVFPYIKSLITNKGEVNFHIYQFEENHGNIEDKLSDLKNIIIKYLPEDCSSIERNKILIELFLLEEDLTNHTLIEDKVLVPLVQQIEKQGDE